MRLQRLKMMGFKSFADSVTIEFDAGVTAIVGPNGSGKSNVVDALAWVLGAQSPRLLRLAKMEELIYAGGDGRQPLGRAEVTIEFDNGDHQVALPMAEIAMGRAITRAGDTQYRLNGAQCRLVDLVDTLSEANLGKTQHVIISQGEIESLANAKGDELRGVLEDAAQVTTLRRRLNQSQRHVESVTQSLHEVSVKERELRRRIKPLRAQVSLYEQRAELTKRRDAVALWVLRRRLEDYREQAQQAEEALAKVTTRLSELQEPQGDAQERPSMLEPLLLRLRATRQEAADLRGEVLAAMSPLTELEARIVRSDAELTMMSDEIGRIEASKREVIRRIDELEQEGEALQAQRVKLGVERHQFDDEAPTRPVELEAQVADLRGRRSHLLAEQRRRSAEEQRRRAEEESRQQRWARASARFDAIEAERREREAELAKVALVRQDLASGLDPQRLELAKAREELTEASGRERELQGQLRALESQVNSLVKLAGSDAATSLGQTLVPRDGLAQAVAGVLGELSDAHVYDTIDELLAALDAGQKDSFVGYVPVSDGSDDASIFLEQAPSWLGPRFHGVRLVESVLAHLRQGDYEGTMVDRSGTIYREGLLRVGASQRAVAQLQLATHQRELAELTQESQAMVAQVSTTRSRVKTLQESLAAAEAQVDTLARREAQIASRLASLASEAGTLAVELEFLQASPQVAEEEFLDVDAELAQIDAQLGAATEQLEERRQATQEYEKKRGELERRDVSIRLKAADLAAQSKAASERLMEFEARETALQQRVERVGRHQVAPLVRVRSLLSQLGSLADQLHEQGNLLRPLEDRVTTARAEEEREYALVKERQAARALERENLANQRLHYATEESRLRSRLLTEEEAAQRATGMPLAHIRQAVLPEGIAPTVAEAMLVELEGQITQVGQVNPLAALELAELEEELERFRVETTDVREAHEQAQRAFVLLEGEMSARIGAMIAEVTVEFDRLMERLFRGGSGAVLLDDPGAPLTSPISLDIKIPAKRVRRLGLLSGGERSLVSLAFLFAVLKVRPVPFVVLDEVEAALDDKNLSAFATLIEDVSRDCQVIVVTHQRRTMEVAAVLIGISMSPRGSSTVVRHVLTDAPQDYIEGEFPDVG
ncbi:AAA family ATPase [Ferrimicrobium sp.]|uniref:AAA family ATPase n=1 Tax=Ferrimicrobium sp. TaxID=2926050 RepID=UPI002618F0C0|nr:AAA family ATPase [Ferrimicrobium sp.]